MSTIDHTALRLERTFAAGAEDVFDAWTNPEVLRRWWAANADWDSPGCKVDLRVGGRYVLRMRNPETGDVHVVEGEYQEIERPRRLVYTWSWVGGSNPGHVSLVAVSFAAETDRRTRVTLEHSGLPSGDSQRNHEKGWIETLANLERRIFLDQHDNHAGGAKR